MARSWSFAHDRRVIELAKVRKSLEEAARGSRRCCTAETVRRSIRNEGNERPFFSGETKPREIVE